MIRTTLTRPWLEARFDTEKRVLSWAVNKPGFALADRIVWREVRNADLPVDLDVDQWLSGELQRSGRTDAVVFLTSRDVSAFVVREHTCDDISAQCVATVGLSNAERVGHRLQRDHQSWGTINIAVGINVGMTDAARIEALTIAAQARTLAVHDVGLQLATGPATGTGTDCIAIASPPGAERYAGLHTAIGEAVGRAVYDAVLQGAQDWMASVREVADV
ncbi:adenosylcobinamide amidohydrolase [Pseudaestuariivita rosea]|uniref:adenosylcobinamide amidohydrolase n=1 Tax=Pseudaestuariivita rosea TaxID=2763263 RepID=UPI001ABA1841|nr:adenosylcobinamide amidohydrolase [Pseudaestuariivita rosea]